MMTINFFNKKSIVVTDEQGEKVKEAKLTGVENIEVGKNLYSVANISSVEEGGVDPIPGDRLDKPFGIIDDGLKCRGRHSIQKELIGIAESEGKVHLLKKDSKAGKIWREEVLATLRASGNDWCDYQKGTCYCNPTPVITMQPTKQTPAAS